MIAHLSGTIHFRGMKFVIVDVGGVGYKITVPTETQKTMGSKGAPVSLFTHLYVRENAMELYGFSTQAELEFFEMLIAISGIGPKSAIGVLSVAPLDVLKRGVASGDASHLMKVSGIGKKIAEKITLELKEKLAGEADTSIDGGDADVLDALVSLGYNAREAREAVRRVAVGARAQEKIKEALRILGGGAI